MNWTYPKIIELAANNLVLEKARSLAVPSRWEAAESNGGLLWGICKSSGQRSYHTVISLSDEAFRCDCRSRHSPCRHALALLVLFVKASPAISLVEAPPDWALQLLKTPAKKVPTAEEKQEREAQRSKRFGQRLQLMEQGVQELEEWLLDLARHGLAGLEGREGVWDQFSARMVDAKLGGIARRIRNLKALSGQPGWYEQLLEEMAALYLFSRSFKQLDSLPEPLQEELLSMGGVNRKKEELLRREGVRGHWLVAGQVEGEGEDDNLRYRRTWLVEVRSGKIALLLDFSWGGKGYEANWVVGSAIEGELVFYPGAYPLRALVRKHRPHYQPLEGPRGFTSLEGFARAYAQALSVNPWLLSFPCLLSGVRVFQEDGGFWLAGQEKRVLPLPSDGEAVWKLLSVSAGRSVQLFGEWNGRQLGPVSVLADGRVIPLQGAAPGPESLEFHPF